MMTTIPQISVFDSQDSQTTLQRLSDSIRVLDAGAMTLAPEPEPTIGREIDRADFEETESESGKPGPLVKRLRAAATRFEFNSEGLQESAISHAVRPFTAATSGRHPGGVVTSFDSSIVDDVAIHAKGMRAGESFELTIERVGSEQPATLLADDSGTLGLIDGEIEPSFTDETESGAGSAAGVMINGEQAERIGEFWVATVNGVEVAVRVNEEALSEGPMVIGTVSKPKGGHGPDALGAPGQLKKLDQHEDGVRPFPEDGVPVDEPMSKVAPEPELRVDVVA